MHMQLGGLFAEEDPKRHFAPDCGQTYSSKGVLFSSNSTLEGCPKVTEEVKKSGEFDAIYKAEIAITPTVYQ